MELFFFPEISIYFTMTPPPHFKGKKRCIHCLQKVYIKITISLHMFTDNKYY
jgi:hypothetical protein